MNEIKDRSDFESAHARICELIDRFEKYARDNSLQPGCLGPNSRDVTDEEIALVEESA